MSVPNIWHHRKVADTSAKGCEICYKPSTSVLVTPENKDFFYVCPSHLKDKGFCSPIIDREAVEAKKKREMDEELDRVKKEYEEKQKKKEAETKKGGQEKEDKEKDKDKDGEDSKKDEKKKDLNSSGKDTPKVEEHVEEEPRIFSLQRTFYQQRVDRKRQAEVAKRNRERLSNPNFFPSVPKGQP